MKSAFDSPLESGFRAVVILVETFPQALDLEHLVFFDYLAVHSGDVEDAPESLHAPLPRRTGEMLVRRTLIGDGLNLMMSRNLVVRQAGQDGFSYRATDNAAPFLGMLGSSYGFALRERVKWGVARFENLSLEEIRQQEPQLFSNRANQFQTAENSVS
jgi:hypothetical protein